MEVSAARHRPAQRDRHSNDSVLHYLQSYSGSEQAMAARLGLACGVHAIYKACGDLSPSLPRLRQLAKAGRTHEVAGALDKHNPCRQTLAPPAALSGRAGRLQHIIEVHGDSASGYDIYPAWWGDGSEAVAAAPPQPTYRLEAETAQQRLQRVQADCHYMSTPAANAETAADLEAAAAALHAAAEKLHDCAARERDITASGCRRTEKNAEIADSEKHDSLKVSPSPVIGLNKLDWGDRYTEAAVLRVKSRSNTVPRVKGVISHQLPKRRDNHSPAFLTSAERLGYASEFLEDRVARQGLPLPRARQQSWRVVSKVGLQLAEQDYQAKRRAEQRAEQLRAAFVKRARGRHSPFVEEQPSVGHASEMTKTGAIAATVEQNPWIAQLLSDRVAC